jgi:Flp pilus assembly protein TadD
MRGCRWRISVRLRRLGVLFLLGACWACAHAPEAPPEAYIRQGRDYQERGLPYEAGLAYRKALRIDPENREARLLLAGALVRSGSHGGAIDQYQRILSDHPDDLEAMAGLCRVYAMTGKRTDWALERMTPLAAVPGTRQHLDLEVLGMLQLNRRRYAEARVSLELALSLIQRGAVMSATDDRARVERLLRQAKIGE